MKKSTPEGRLEQRLFELSEQNLNLKATVSRMRAALEAIRDMGHGEGCAISDWLERDNNAVKPECTCWRGPAEEALK